MRDEPSAPRIRLCIVDEIRLPKTSALELFTVLEGWEVVEKPPAALRRLVAKADLDEADVVLLEIVADAARPDDVRAALRSAEVQPGCVTDALRLILVHACGGIPPFPFICFGDGSVVTSPLLERTGSNTLVFSSDVALQDDERRPELGWTDHCFVPARRVSTRGS